MPVWRATSAREIGPDVRTASSTVRSFKVRRSAGTALASVI
jgi:hypothetical protein